MMSRPLVLFLLIATGSAMKPRGPPKRSAAAKENAIQQSVVSKPPSALVQTRTQDTTASMEAIRKKALDAGFQGPATTTRYWDCAYQHCHQFLQKVPVNMQYCPEPTKFLNETTYTKVVKKKVKGFGLMAKEKEVEEKVTETDFFAHPEVAVFEQDGHLYGTAAVSSSLGLNKAEDGSPGCGKCYDLQAMWGPASGKPITVMATNWCPECNEGVSPWGSGYHKWHFDFAVPGGGQGMAPHCQLQYPQVKPEQWLVNSVEGCDVMPDELKGSCVLGQQHLGGWPDVMFKEVSCPDVLVKRLGCQAEAKCDRCAEKNCDCKWSLQEGACAIPQGEKSECWKTCCTPF